MMKILLNNNNGANTLMEAVSNEMMKITEASKFTVANGVAGLYNSEERIDKRLLDTALTSVDTRKLDNIQRAFAVASFATGSMVGITTIGIETALTLATSTCQYLDKDGKVNAKKVERVVKNIGEKPEAGYRYVSVFNYNVNKALAISKFSRASIFIRVSAHEIKAFQKRIRKIDMTAIQPEDLVTIAYDMDIIGRALQELSIDVTKDKSKDIGYDINSLINMTNKTKSNAIKNAVIKNNIEDIISEKIFKGTVTKKYSMEAIIDGKPMSQVDVNDKEELNNAYIDNLGGDCKDAINAGYMKGFEPIVELLKVSNNDAYQAFKNRVVTASQNSNQKDVIMNQIITAARVAMDIINNLYGKKQYDNTITTSYIKEVAAKLRNAIYTVGAKYGVDPVNTVKIAMSAPFAKIVNGELKVKERPTSLKAILDIFPKEFVVEYVCNPYDTEQSKREVAESACYLTVTFSDYDLCLGDELDFEDSLAMTEYGMVSIKEKFSGKAVVTEEGLKAVVDIYAFEYTDAVFLSEIYQNNEQSFNAPFVQPICFTKDSDESNIDTSIEMNAIREKIDTCLDAGTNGVLLCVKTKEGNLSKIGRLAFPYQGEVKIKDYIINTSCGVVLL